MIFFNQDDREQSILVQNWYSIHPVNVQMLNADADESYTNPIPESSANTCHVDRRAALSDAHLV